MSYKKIAYNSKLCKKKNYMNFSNVYGIFEIFIFIFPSSNTNSVELELENIKPKSNLFNK